VDDRAAAPRAGGGADRPGAWARRDRGPLDAAVLLDPGPWEHRFVSANGCRFHVAEAGPQDAGGPLVVLLHGFPQSWRTWRHHLPVLAAAGHRVAALDLRGHGASDKPPRGYDITTLAADVAGVVRSLGAADAVVVGTGSGAWTAWSMPALEPEVTRAVAVLGGAHPLVSFNTVLSPPSARLLAELQVPFRPERALRDGALVERALRAGGPDAWVSDEVLLDHHREVRVPFTAQCALEQHRWVARSRVRGDGHPHRGLDDALAPAAVARRSAALTAGSYRWAGLAGTGHFVTEEAPAAGAELLVDWLAGL
jgi:pimeloyl-ACP methyl ester carboxylesterase